MFETNEIMQPRSEQFSCWYKLLSRLLASAKPGDKLYSTLVDKLLDITLAPSEIVECFKFIQDFRSLGDQSQCLCLSYAPLLNAVTLGIYS